jgi:hypothetical protein
MDMWKLPPPICKPSISVIVCRRNVKRGGPLVHQNIAEAQTLNPEHQKGDHLDWVGSVCPVMTGRQPFSGLCSLIQKRKAWRGGGEKVN